MSERLDVDLIRLLPAPRYPDDWFNEELVVRVSTQWRKKLAAIALDLTRAAAANGMELTKPIKIEDIIRGLIFSYIETRWDGEFIGELPAEKREEKTTPTRRRRRLRDTDPQKVLEEIVRQHEEDQVRSDKTESNGGGSEPLLAPFMSLKR